jgi:DNA-directed RNA polymerase subunit N (RpoN/RPB10)
MIIPICCVTCGKVLADKWEYYKKKVEELKNQDKAKPNGAENPTFVTEIYTTGKILDELGLTKYCCRRHMIGHVDIIDDL